MMGEWYPQAYGLLWWGGIGLLGLAVGVVGGMFGVGGNFLLIPLLSLGFHVPLPIAVGTSLCQVIGASTASLVRHVRLRQGESIVGWIMMGGALIGSYLGASSLGVLWRMADISVMGQSMPVAKLVLSLTFSLILLLVAVAMAKDVRTRPATTPLGPGPLTRFYLPPMVVLPRSGRTVSVPLIAYLGLTLGFLNGLVGMGGGVILLPVLLYGIGMRIHIAVGTGNLLLVASAVAGTLTHARLGHVHLGLALILLMGSTLGAPLGATIASHADGRRLRALFAGTICVTVIAVLIDLATAVRG
jgi:uncharacterized protein